MLKTLNSSPDKVVADKKQEHLSTLRNKIHDRVHARVIERANIDIMK